MARLGELFDAPVLSAVADRVTDAVPQPRVAGEFTHNRRRACKRRVVPEPQPPHPFRPAADAHDLRLQEVRASALDPRVAGLQPDRAGWRACVFDGRHDREPVSQEARRIGVRVSGAIPKGKQAHPECLTCHATEKGVNGGGPMQAGIVGSQGRRRAGLPVLGADEAQRHRLDDQEPGQVHRRPASCGAWHAHALLRHARSQAARPAHPAPGDVEVASGRRSLESACSGI